MAPIANVAPLIPAGNPDPCPAPRCGHCGTPQLPRRHAKPPADCGLTQLGLSYEAKTRRVLLQLLLHSRLPQAEFAVAVLGVDQATLYRYLRGKPIPHSKAVKIHSIEHIGRQDSTVHIIVRTTPESSRWRAMEHARRRDYAELFGSDKLPLAQ